MSVCSFFVQRFQFGDLVLGFPDADLWAVVNSSFGMRPPVKTGRPLFGFEGFWWRAGLRH